MLSFHFISHVVIDRLYKNFTLFTTIVQIYIAFSTENNPWLNL